MLEIYFCECDMRTLKVKRHRPWQHLNLVSMNSKSYAINESLMH